MSSLHGKESEMKAKAKFDLFDLWVFSGSDCASGNSSLWIISKSPGRDADVDLSLD